MLIKIIFRNLTFLVALPFTRTRYFPTREDYVTNQTSLYGAAKFLVKHLFRLIQIMDILNQLFLGLFHG